jgi:hypothetical protein
MIDREEREREREREKEKEREREKCNKHTDAHRPNRTP